MMKKAMPVQQKSNPKIYLGQMCNFMVKNSLDIFYNQVVINYVLGMFL